MSNFDFVSLLGNSNLSRPIYFSNLKEKLLFSNLSICILYGLILSGYILLRIFIHLCATSDLCVVKLDISDIIHLRAICDYEIIVFHIIYLRAILFYLDMK